jgi:hypothetical protein
VAVIKRSLDVKLQDGDSHLYNEAAFTFIKDCESTVQSQGKRNAPFKETTFQRKTNKGNKEGNCMTLQLAPFHDTGECDNQFSRLFNGMLLVSHGIPNEFDEGWNSSIEFKNNRCDAAHPRHETWGMEQKGRKAARRHLSPEEGPQRSLLPRCHPGRGPEGDTGASAD